MHYESMQMSHASVVYLFQFKGNYVVRISLCPFHDHMLNMIHGASN